MYIEPLLGTWDGDIHTPVYHTHFRDYDPTTGRWDREDPAGYVDGLNLYQAYFGVNGVDATGLDVRFRMGKVDGKLGLISDKTTDKSQLYGLTPSGSKDYIVDTNIWTTPPQVRRETINGKVHYFTFGGQLNPERVNTGFNSFQFTRAFKRELGALAQKNLPAMEKLYKTSLITYSLMLGGMTSGGGFGNLAFQSVKNNKGLVITSTINTADSIATDIVRGKEGWEVVKNAGVTFIVNLAGGKIGGKIIGKVKPGGFPLAANEVFKHMFVGGISNATASLLKGEKKLTIIGSGFVGAGSSVLVLKSTTKTMYVYLTGVTVRESAIKSFAKAYAFGKILQILNIPIEKIAGIVVEGN